MKYDKMSGTYTIGQFAKKIGVTPATLRNWDKRGVLVANRTPTNNRFYTEEHLLVASDKINYKRENNRETGIAGKVVLITGGTGTLGHALVDRFKDYAKKVIVYSRCELKQANMQTKFCQSNNIRYLIGDIKDENRITQAMRGVDICIHAAALKRIETNSYNPFEAVKTNIIGSMNVIKACLATNVSKAIVVSTDKSCSPATLYGGAKFVAEQLFINGNNYAPRDKIIFSAVRYGNIYGSNGSIKHIFEKQAKENNEITITHSEMTRFFMSVEDSVDLILAAINLGLGGDIFIPKMKAIGIKEFVEMFFPDVPIKVIGLRGHEKIHEELVSETESRYIVECGDKYYKIIPPHASIPGLGWDINYPAEKRLKSFKYRSDGVEKLTKEDFERFNGNS